MIEIRDYRAETAAPKVGNRVKVTIETEVLYLETDGEVRLDAGWFTTGREGVVSIEVIPEPFVLPTKRWAQVLGSNGLLWTRTRAAESYGYDWVSIQGHQISSDDLLAYSGLRVISEGVSDE